MKLADILSGVLITAGIRLAANPHQKVKDALANAAIDTAATAIEQQRSPLSGTDADHKSRQENARSGKVSVPERR